jgi:hypothetical protein
VHIKNHAKAFRMIIDPRKLRFKIHKIDVLSST